MTVTGNTNLGPIVGAEVQFYEVGADGTNQGSVIATTQTDVQGQYTARLTSNGDAFRAAITGGTYQDEETGNVIQNSATLTAIVTGVSSGTQSQSGLTLNINPLTTSADQLAVLLLGNGGSLQDAISSAHTQVASFFNLPPGTDPRTATPVDYSNPTSVSGASAGALAITAALAGLSNYASASLGMPNANGQSLIISQVVQTLASAGQSPSPALSEGIQQATLTWLNSPKNVGNIPTSIVSGSSTSGSSSSTSGGGTSSSSSSTSSGGNTSATLVSISVTPATFSLAQGLTQQVTVTGTYSDNSTANITDLVTWTVPVGFATVTNHGLVTGLAQSGSSNITATLGGVSGSATMSATAALLVSVTVGPSGISLPVGAQQQFRATAIYSNNASFTIPTGLTWSSGTTSVATITGQGVATVVASSGTTTITAVYLGVSGSTTLTAVANLGADPAQVAINPITTAVDSQGNVFMTDKVNNKVLALAAITGSILGVPVVAGEIYTVAGNGSAGYSGDGGPAANAQLYGPTGIAADSSGNLYIAEYDNDRVRVVAAATGSILGIPVTKGDIYTVAGNGTYTYGGDGGPATSAGLPEPYGVAIDASGNLYVTDITSRVRVVAAESGTILNIPVTPGNIYTVAGKARYEGFSGDGGPAISAMLNSPNAVAVDNAGNLYIADTQNNRIRKVTLDGTITTVAGNGTYGYSGDSGAADSAELAFPDGIAVDSSGNIYISDNRNNRVRVVAANTGNILGVAVTEGEIYTVAGNGSESNTSAPNATLSEVVGDNGPAVSGALNYPSGVTLDSKGNLYIPDQGHYLIRFVAAISGTVLGSVVSADDITTIAGNGSL